MQHSLYPTDPIGQMLDAQAAAAADILVDASLGWALIHQLFGELMPGAPADLVGGVADVALGAHYCADDIDWAAVEDERIGD